MLSTAFLSGMPGPLKALGPIVGVITVIPFLVGLFSITIEQGEMGLYLCRGKTIVRGGTPKCIGPGWHFKIPVLYTIVRINIRDETRMLATTCVDRYGVQYAMEASITYHTMSDGVSLAKAYFGSITHDTTITRIAGSHLGKVMKHIDDHDIDDDAQILKHLDERCAPHIATYGSELVGVELTQFARSAPQLQKEGMIEGRANVEAAAVVSDTAPIGIVA